MVVICGVINGRYMWCYTWSLYVVLYMVVKCGVIYGRYMWCYIWSLYVVLYMVVICGVNSPTDKKI